MKNKRVFIIHGWDGVPNDSWKPWIKRELEKNNFEVIAPQMPGGNNPVLKDWLIVINDLVKNPSIDDYFIGHSLGCITICKYIESLPENAKLGGCVLISGFCTSLNVPEIDNFTEVPLDSAKVRIHTSNFTLIHSKDDEDVPLYKAKELQEILGAKIILEEGLGHISEGDGVKELPSLLKSIEEMSK